MFKIRVMMRFDKPRDVRVRAWRDLLRSAMVQVGYYWHRRMAPLHFKSDARGRYGYQPRTQKYEESKNKKGKPDLVFSGDTYRAVVQGMPQVRGFPTRARVHYDTPDYVQMRPMPKPKPKGKGNPMPNLGAEIAKVTADEGIELGRFAAAEVERGITRLHGVETVHIN